MSILNKGSKSQSAMEYLMTYGWAILIIAVVLAVLFSLNVFSPSLGTACIGQPGYACSSPIITSGGMLSFSFGLGTGATAYNVLFTCVSNSNSLGASNPNLLWYTVLNLQTSGVYLGITNSLAPMTSSSSLSLTSGTGSTVAIAGVQCYGVNGPSSLSPIGTGFSGAIWMASTPSGTGNLNFVKIARFTAKSSS